MPSSKHFNQHTPLMQRFEASYTVDQGSGCWLWNGWLVKSATGDVRPRIRVDGKNKIAYRLAYELLVGEIPPGKLCCHHCDVSICVNPSHLFIGTQKDNSLDSIAKGRHTSQRHPEAARERGRLLGTTNTWSKGSVNYANTSQADREAICSRRDRGEPYSSIARDYKMTKEGIFLLVKREKARAALYIDS